MNGTGSKLEAANHVQPKPGLLQTGVKLDFGESGAAAAGAGAARNGQHAQPQIS